MSSGLVPARRVLLVGPPGSGKSTQGSALAERFGGEYISTGVLLRDEVRRGSPIGRQAAADMSAGRLVPDWLITFALERRMSDALRYGFVLDGYPRTLEQAEAFMRSLGRTRLDRVIELDIPDTVTMLRLEHRGRGDDDRRVVRSRLDIYRRETTPMLGFFEVAGLLATIDGARPPEVVASDLARLFVADGQTHAGTSTGLERTMDSPERRVQL
jgi:adenylate kinase